MDYYLTEQRLRCRINTLSKSVFETMFCDLWSLYLENLVSKKFEIADLLKMTALLVWMGLFELQLISRVTDLDTQQTAITQYPISI